MVSTFNPKKAMVISVLVYIFSLIHIEASADQGWERRTQLPTKRVGFATAVVGHKVYLIGGTLYKDKAIQRPYGNSTLEVYDTQKSKWQRGADMPTPRHSARAAVVNGTIFVFGGWHGENHALAEGYPVSVEAYNPRTNTWIQKKDMPVSRVAFGIGVVDEKIYIIGGMTRFGEAKLDRVDVYNPATNTWVEGQKMPTPRHALGVGVVGKRIYTIDGRGRPRGKQDTFLTVIEEYDSLRHQWRKKGDMLDTRLGLSPVVVRDSIYLIGGFIWRGVGFEAEYLASVNVYNLQKDAWSNIPAMPRPLVYHTAAVNGRIYVFGGMGNVGKGWRLFPDVLVYDTGFRAVEASGKLPTRWGELKAPQQNPW